MSDLNLKTTMEIQSIRDQSQQMINLISRSFTEGLVTAYERRKQITPYQELLDQCTQRLMQDWAFAMKVAEQLG